MYRMAGKESVSDLAAQILTIEGEPMQTRIPVQPPRMCPRCAAPLCEAKPLTVRLALLQELETYQSTEPTETRALCLKLLHAPDPLELENAELARLKAAVQANGIGFRDCLQALLQEYIETAVSIDKAAVSESA